MRSILRASALCCAVLLLGCKEPPRGPRYRGAGDAHARGGGTLVVHHEADVRGLDPATSYDEVSQIAIKLLFDGLLDYDFELNLVPRLAIALPTISQDGKTFTFHLKRGIRFSNGRELIADDVRWSMEHMLTPSTSSPGVGFFSLLVGLSEFTEGRAPHVSGIRVLDRYTIEFELTAADQTFLNAMAMPFSYPVPRENYAAHPTDVARHPVGPGAYTLEEWEPGVRLIFQRNPRYFEASTPRADRVLYEVNLQRESAFLRFRNGDLDHAHRFTPADRLFLRRSTQWTPYRVEGSGGDIWGLAMNCEMAPFDNVHVRRAVAFAIDRERWSRARNYANRPIGQALPPEIPGYSPTLSSVQSFNRSRAREELALAGYPNGIAAPVTMWISEGATGTLYAELAQADLRAIGIKLEIKQVSFSIYLQQTARAHTAQMSLAGWNQDFPSAATFLDILFHSRNARPADAENRAFYRNASVDALLDRARTERDSVLRRNLYEQANEIVTRDAPWAFLFTSIRMEAYQPYVRNYRIHGLWSEFYRDVWLDLPRQRVAMRAAQNPWRNLAALMPFGGL